TNGNFPAAALQIPLLLSRGAKAEWGLAVKDHRKAFFINHTSDRGDHVWSSLSQTVTGLKENGFYIPSFWIWSERLTPKALFVVRLNDWSQQPWCYAKPGEYGWMRVVCEAVNIGPRTSVDLRFVIQAPARVWITDVALHET